MSSALNGNVSNDDEDNDATIHLSNLPDHVSSNQSPVPGTVDEDDLNSGISIFSRLASSRLRWGVVQMPQGWYKPEPQVPIEHITFGVEEDGVLPPVPGGWYA